MGSAGNEQEHEVSRIRTMKTDTGLTGLPRLYRTVRGGVKRKNDNSDEDHEESPSLGKRLRSSRMVRRK
jgi:hypothetical protein